jgi:ABC-type microcin C transport system duplicated ATPase subunit YejF
MEIPAGSAVGLVGESGSGKSTLLRCLMRLEHADEGAILYEGQDVTRLRGSALLAYRRGVQMVFQDPMASINPRMSVQTIVEEGMLIHRIGKGPKQREARVCELLEMVGLDPDNRSRRPASFSGGQRQRIAIARALAVEPKVLVCDEPVSALDVSVQAQILNLLRDMQQSLGLSLLFVAHDLGVVRYLCPDIYVLRGGEVVEHAPRERIFDAPQHEYTKQLIAALPAHDRLLPAGTYGVPPTEKLEA